MVGSASACAVWASLIPEWTGEKPILVDGGPVGRALMWEDCLRAREGIWICTYDVFRLDITTRRPKLHKWDMVICDEIHKIRNRKTKRYEALLCLKSTYMLGASATVVDRGPADLWAFLHLVDRRMFSSYWSFVEKYCWTVPNDFGGKAEVLGVRNPEKLKEVLSKYAVRRTWEQVGMQLPTLRRAVINLDMTEPQSRSYFQLMEEMELVADDGRVVVTATQLALLVRLRQMATFPQVLGMDDEGCMLHYLGDALDDDPHTVIFTPFAQSILYIERYMKKMGHKDVFDIHGGLRARDLMGRIQSWKSSRGIMICTIQFAESFALDTVNTAYFTGFEWSPDMNTQAEGRLQRMNSKLPNGVSVQYLLPKLSIYEHVREVLNGKQVLVNQVLAAMRGG